MSWPQALGRLAGHLVLVGLAFLVIGETWFRLPWTTKLVVFEFDDQRGSRLAAPQSRGIGLGNFSRVSPPIGINADGYRNGDIDWARPTVLAVGSSEMLGPGVEDGEVWTALATERLSLLPGEPVTVVNAGSVGYGPYHHAVTVREFLAHHPPPRAIVLRASISDRRFFRPSPQELESARRQKAISEAVKSVSEFLPFLINKLQAQVIAIRNTFRPNTEDAQHTPAHAAPAVADEMWRAHGQWWADIVSQASAAGVPLLFFVDGGDGSASAARLAQLLSEAFGGQKGVTVALFDAHATGLAFEPDAVRRRRFGDELTLGDDPHANAKLHGMMADFLTPRIADLVSAPDAAHLPPARSNPSAHTSSADGR